MNESEPVDFMSLVGSLVPVFTLVLGMILSPWVNNIYKKPIECRRIKAGIIEKLYILFNYYKEHQKNINNREFYRAFLRSIYSLVNSPSSNLSEEDKEKLLNTGKELKAIDWAVRYPDYFAQMLLIEGDILRLNTEAVSFFSRNVHAALNGKIKAILKRLNDPERIHLFPYGQLSYEQVRFIDTHQFPDEITAAYKKIQTECDEAVDAIEEILR